MALTEKLYNKMAERYGHDASWALWNDAHPVDTRIISESLHELHTRVVMVGLNISAQIPGTWLNFRDGDKPARLRRMFNHSNYRGAYMTDLIKGVIGGESDEIMRRVKPGESDRIDMGQHIAAFREEMNLLGVERNALFILFGNGVTHLYENSDLKDLYPNHVKCEHYSNRFTNHEKWDRDARADLEDHYQKTKDKYNTPPLHPSPPASRVKLIKGQFRRDRDTCY
ncbi:hypothetical protein BH18ACI2_BH18ACI2_02980 [soil metagenome]